jgi:NAD(P)H dehydrogenase (quinone)
MAKVLVIYHSRTGNTAKMAQLIADAVAAEGVEAFCLSVQDAKTEELLAADLLWHDGRRDQAVY